MLRHLTLRWALAAAVVAGGFVAGAADAHMPSDADASPIVRPAASVPPVSTPPLRLVSRSQNGPRLTELEFSTPYLEGTTRVRVLTPVGYDQNSGSRWPVLLLLHGTSETLPGQERTGYTNWTDRGNAEAITRPGDFLVVMPEAGAGYYTDHYGLAGEGGPAWESYHTRQLLPWIDAHYRTIPTRAARAVAGLSMGGGGAMMYAARHPDLFSFAQAYSGAVDATDPERKLPVDSPVRATDINQATQPLDGRPPLTAFGPWATEEVRTRTHYPIDIVGNLRRTVLTLRTGNGKNEQGVITDPAEFGVHGQNVNLHEALARAGIAHTYDDYGAGDHTYYYFSRGLKQMVAPLNAHFASGAGKAPTSFSYRTAEERADVYAYRITSDRGFLEFADLDIAPGQLAVAGSGIFTITTPGQYVPGALYRLTASRNDLVQQAVVTADRDGRLSFAVDTGRRSTGQQYRHGTATLINQVQIKIHRA